MLWTHIVYLTKLTLLEMFQIIFSFNIEHELYFLGQNKILVNYSINAFSLLLVLRMLGFIQWGTHALERLASMTDLCKAWPFQKVPCWPVSQQAINCNIWSANHCLGIKDNDDRYDLHRFSLRFHFTVYYAILVESHIEIFISLTNCTFLCFFFFFQNWFCRRYMDYWSHWWGSYASGGWP